MIKSSELRIGNWVLSDGEPRQVLRINWTNNPVKHYEPIPLTEDLLLNCRFEKDVDYYCEPEWDFYIRYSTTEEHFYYVKGMSRMEKPITSLHQLQNLYYALTSTELNVKL